MYFKQASFRDDATLILGMIGFGPEQDNAIAGFLAERPEGPVRWRTGSLSEADAWCVNGARAHLLADGSLSVAAGAASSPRVRLALEEVDRPVGFSEPLASRQYEPAYSFRMGDEGSLDAMLKAFERRWLASKAACLWLGRRLIAAEQTFQQRVYHLVHDGRLVAVVDRAGDAGLMQAVDVAILEEAAWLGRPSSAAYIPPSFQRTSVPELLWAYALRTEADLLPGRYRKATMYFRRPPRVPQRLVGDDQLLVMRELVGRSQCFDALAESTGMGPRRLARSLAALYLTGSITTSPQRASDYKPGGSGERRGGKDDSSWAPAAGSAFSTSSPGCWLDVTVPANLSRERPAGGIASPARAD